MKEMGLLRQFGGLKIETEDINVSDAIVSDNKM